MRIRITHWLIGILLLGMYCFSTPRAHAQQVAPAPNPGVFTLDMFGSIKAGDVQATFDKAVQTLLAAGGGTLVISKDVPMSLNITNNTQEAFRMPDAPAPATRWGAKAGVTIVDTRTGTTRVFLPQLSGMVLDRNLRLPEGQSMGSWEFAPMISMNNTIVRGTTSYRDQMIEAVPGGKDQRFYMRTIRGVFPGQFLNIEYGGALERIYVKSIGYDKQKKAPFLVADSPEPENAGAYLTNKNHAQLMMMRVNSHTEEQTFDVWLERHKYSQGDTYLFQGRFWYNSDVHSTGGDENGVIYAAFPRSELNVFGGTVATFNPATNELKFNGSSTTMGSGRPMINMNKAKWITGGTLIMVRPGAWISFNDPSVKDPVFEGKTYPTTLEEGSRLRIGGLMRFSKDAPLTEAVIGRYFAVDVPGEYVQGTGDMRRWYYIGGFKQNPDGTKEITVVRHWWGAKTAGSVTLYDDDNYTSDGHIVPLKYVIAPGANVYDVADAVGSPKAIVKVAPGPDTGTPFDFAPNDAIAQAIGPDPFRPIPFRAWGEEYVPGIFPSPVFDISNGGSVQRFSVLSVRGGAASMDNVAKRYDKKTVFQSAINVQASTDNTIIFDADVKNSALLFRQPNKRAQPMKWLYDEGRKEVALTVSPVDGTFSFTGGSVAMPAGVTQVSGLSATTTKAQNLRGIDIPVPVGSKQFVVKFPQPEKDNTYAVFLELPWLTHRAITNKTPEGFTVQFETAAPQGAKLDWMLVR